MIKLAEAPEFDDYQPDQHDAALEAAEAAANEARIAKVSALLAAWRSRYR